MTSGMHFAALRPDLKVGDIVEAGEEIGIMGSTAILESRARTHRCRRPAQSPRGCRPLYRVESIVVIEVSPTEQICMGQETCTQASQRALNLHHLQFDQI